MGDKLRSQSVVVSVLFTHEGKNPLEYFIQLLRVFLKAIFIISSQKPSPS